MRILSRDDVLAAKLRFQVVEVPEWGGAVHVWELSALRRLELEEALRERKDAPGTERAVEVARWCVGDAAGPYDPPLEVADLQARSAAALLRVSQAALRLNVLSGAAAEEVAGE